MIWKDGRLTDEYCGLLLEACRQTAHAQVEPEHFVLTLLEPADGSLRRECRRLAPTINPDAFLESFRQSARSLRIAAPPSSSWSDTLLTVASRKLLDEAVRSPEWNDGLADRFIAAAALEKLPPRIANSFGYAGIPLDRLIAALRLPPAADGPQPTFNAAGKLNPALFSKSGRAVLHTIEQEGKENGLVRVGTPLLLFALASQPGSELEKGLRLQPAVRFHDLLESLRTHLRGLSKGRFNDELSLIRDQMQPVVVRTFERAVRTAADRDPPLASEADIGAALLNEEDSFVRGFLESRSVDVGRLSGFLAGRRPEAETPDEEVRKLPPLAEVEVRLRRNIVGQDHVIDTLIPFLKRIWFGYTRKRRPLGVLLFLGASGTGKTQLAREIAREVYGSEDRLLFFEMGQFGTEQSKNVFVGAPQGYVGYGEGLLTNGLKNNPESVVLFDEVEKAHRSVFDVLLRFLDEGVIADPAGPVRDGRRCFIILTSNHSVEKLSELIRMQSQAARGNGAMRERVRSDIRNELVRSKLFRPEFVNRMDELVLFNSLGESAFRTILALELESETRRLLEEKNVTVTFDPSVVEGLAKICAKRHDEGARLCGNLISTLVVPAIIDFFVDDANRGVRSARVAAGSDESMLVTAAGSDA
ncbi:MAG: AAA family ATPase [Planctomycetaceae bacterium]|nr:AAA family ATPase [Planctomycetaceae bacterium]